MEETMMYENVWVDEDVFVNGRCNPRLSASDSFSFNVPYPEKIDRDAWNTQLVPEFANLGFVCPWWNEHEMGCTINPAIDIPRMDVAMRAEESLEGFTTGFSAKTALKILSGDYRLVFRDFDDKISENSVCDRLNQFVDKYEEFMQVVGQQFPCEIKHNPSGLKTFRPVSPDGAVNYIWKKVYQKLPMIKEAILRERRKPTGVSVPRRCH